MAVKKGDAAASLNREVEDTVEVFRVEAHVPMHLPIPRLWQDYCVDERRYSTLSEGWSPERERQVLIARISEEMCKKHIMY